MLLLDAILAGWLLVTLLAGPAFLMLARLWKRTYRSYHPDLIAWPALSIIRPIRGTSPHLYGNLESALTCRYPAERELLCCVETEDDSAMEVIQRLQWHYPEQVRLIVSYGAGSIFGKHANLIAGYNASRHEVIVCSDADVALTELNLLDLIPPLYDPRVGGATACFWQMPEAGFANWLMAIFVTTYGYAPNLAARQVRQLPNAIGGLMAYRKDTLDAMGGFAAIIHDRISDDGALGNAVWGSGREMFLSIVPFLSRRSEPSVRAVCSNVHRWMLMFKGQGTRAYFQMLAVSPWLPLALWGLSFAAGLSTLSARDLATIALSALMLEAAVGLLTVRLVLPVQNIPAALGLGRPLAQLLFSVTWCWALVTSTTEWGGRRYRVPFGGQATLLGWVTPPMSQKVDTQAPDMPDNTRL